MGIELGDRCGSAAVGGNLIEDFANAGSEKDDAGGAPGATTRGGSIAKRADGIRGDIESLQLAVGEEADAGAVGGPEREISTVSARQAVLSAGTQRAIPQVVAGAKNDGGAIRREGRRATEVTFDLEG